MTATDDDQWVLWVFSGHRWFASPYGTQDEINAERVKLEASLRMNEPHFFLSTTGGVYLKNVDWYIVKPRAND